MLYIFFEELSAAAGGIILMIILLIVTAVVFAIKFALDIALNKGLRAARQPQHEDERGAPLYAVKNESAPRKRKTASRSAYTIVPGDKLYILENPKDRRL